MKLSWIALAIVVGCHARGRSPAVENAHVGPTFEGHGEVSPETIAVKWLAGAWAPSELVDPRRGLVHFWTETGDVDPSRPDIHVHLCGAELDAALRGLDEGIETAMIAADGDGVICTERECRIDVASEWEPGRIAVFDVRAGAPTAFVAYLELARFTPDAEEQAANVRAWAEAEVMRSCLAD